MKFPNIWGHGAIFAFSGLDGECCFDNAFLGTLCGGEFGVVFHLPVKRVLRFNISHIRDLRFEIVASDIVVANIECSTIPIQKRISMAFYKQDIVLGTYAEEALPFVYCLDKHEEIFTEEIIVQKSEQSYTALALNKKMGTFVFAYSKKSQEDVLLKIKYGLTADVEQVIAEKLAFFTSLPNLDGLDEGIERTLGKCYSVLKSQVYSPQGQFKSLWTTPDRIPHKKLWLWDSVFHSIGNKYISTQLAYQSIKAVLDTQREDGFIAHMSDPDNSSDITQPPIIAWGIYQLYQHCGDKSTLTDNFEKLKKYLQWNILNRDSNKNDLYEWKVALDSVHCRCDECGMDNSPRFDNVVVMDCIDFSCFMANEARCMSRIADILNLEQDSAYWSSLYTRISNAINKLLWDKDNGFYYDRILQNGTLKKVKSVSSFLPIFAGLCTKKQAETLVQHLMNACSFNTPFPIPSISLEDETFGSDMWRGPVWINYNYLISLGLQEFGYNELAEKIIKKTIEIISSWYIQDGTIYEFYDSTNKVSPKKLNRKGVVIEPYDLPIRMQCIRDYGWTAALFVEMVLNIQKK